MRKETFNRALVLSLAASMMASTTPLQPIQVKAASEETQVKKNDTLALTLNYSTYTVKKGETLKLKASISQATEKNKKITWYTSDKNIVSVTQDGVVTGVKKGKATITAQIDGTKVKTKCTVTVGTAVTGLTVKEKTQTVKEGNTLKLGATVTPSNASNKKLTYTSSDKTIATVSSSGVVTAKKPGKAVITIKTTDGSAKTAKVTVTVEEAVTDLVITKNSLKNNKLTLTGGTYNNVTIENSVGSQAAIYFKNIKVKGNLILQDGVDYNVAVNMASNVANVICTSDVAGAQKGITKLSTEGKKSPTFKAKGSSVIGKIIVDKASSFALLSNKKATIKEVEVIHKANEKTNLSLTAYNGALKVQGAENGELNVVLSQSTISNVSIEGTALKQKVIFNATTTSTLKKIETNAPSSQVIINGVNAKVSELITNAKGVLVSILEKANVGNIIIKGENTFVNVDKDSSIDNIDVQEKGGTIQGEGNVKQVKVSADGTKIETVGTKVEVDNGVDGTIAGGIGLNGGAEITTGTNSSDSSASGSSSGESSSGGSSSGGSSGGGDTVWNPEFEAAVSELRKILDNYAEPTKLLDGVTLQDIEKAQALVDKVSQIYRPSLQKKVDLAKEFLKERTLKEIEEAEKAIQIQFAEGDNENSVTSAFELPKTGLHGTEITWESDSDAVVIKDGVVTIQRPLYVDGNKEVILRAVVQKNGVSSPTAVTKKVVIVSVDKTALQGAIITIKEAITKEDIKKILDNPEYVAALELNVTGFDILVETEQDTVLQSIVDWETRKDFGIEIGSSLERAKKQFNQKWNELVSREETDNQKEKDSKDIQEALDLLDTYIFDGEIPDDRVKELTESIILPTNYRNDVSVQWIVKKAETSPAKTGNFDNHGTVVRPDYSDGVDGIYTLTAICTKGIGEVENNKKVYNIVIKKAEANPEQKAIEAVKKANTKEAVREILENEEYVKVIGLDLSIYNGLSNTYKERIQTGLADWTDKKDLGIVIGGNLVEAKAAVVAKFNALVTIQLEDMGQADASQDIKDALEYVDKVIFGEGDIPENREKVLIKSIVLPTISDKNVTITWSVEKVAGSAETGKFDNKGNVERPDYAKGMDGQYILTATCTKKPGSVEPNTRTYQIIITKEDATIEQKAIEGIKSANNKETIRNILDSSDKAIALNLDMDTYAIYKGLDSTYQEPVQTGLADWKEKEKFGLELEDGTEQSLKTARDAVKAKFNELVKAQTDILEIKKANEAVQDALKYVDDELLKTTEEKDNRTKKVIKDIPLPTKYEGVTITWKAEESKDNKATTGSLNNEGEVTRPAYAGKEKATYILTATCTKDLSTITENTRVFTIEILAEEATIEQQAIERIKEADSQEKVKEILDNAKLVEDLRLNTDTYATYQGLDTTYQGKVQTGLADWEAKKDFGLELGEGQSLEQARNAVKAKFNELVKAQTDIIEREQANDVIEKALKHIDEEMLKTEEEIKTRTRTVTEDIPLPTYEGVTITWKAEKSENSKATTGSLNNKGEVTRPAYAGKEKAVYILTATCTKEPGQVEKNTREFIIEIPIENPTVAQQAIENIKAGDQEKVKKILDDATFVSALKLNMDIYATYRKLDDTYQKAVQTGFVEWEEKKNLGLELGEGKSLQKAIEAVGAKFDELVKAQITASETEKANKAVQDALKHIESELLKTEEEKENRTKKVTENITLPVYEGVTITWKAEKKTGDNATTGKLTDEGKVEERPTYAGEKNAIYTLTATCTKEFSTVTENTKVFTIEILKEEATIEQQAIEKLKIADDQEKVKDILQDEKLANALSLNADTYAIYQGLDTTYQGKVQTGLAEWEAKKEFGLELGAGKSLQKAIEAVCAKFDELVKIQTNDIENKKANEAVQKALEHIDNELLKTAEEKENRTKKVTENITLPVYEGVTITWKAEKKAESKATTGKLTDEGVVERPDYAGKEDAVYTLTATCEKDLSTVTPNTKEFTIIIKKKDASPIQSAIETFIGANTNALMKEAIQNPELGLDVKAMTGTLGEDTGYYDAVLEALVAMNKEGLKIEESEIKASKDAIAAEFNARVEEQVIFKGVVDAAGESLKKAETVMSSFDSIYKSNKNKFTEVEQKTAERNLANVKTAKLAVEGLVTAPILFENQEKIKNATQTLDEKIANLERNIDTLKIILQVAENLKLENLQAKDRDTSKIVGDVLQIVTAEDLKLPKTIGDAEDKLEISWSSSNDEIIQTKTVEGDNVKYEHVVVNPPYNHNATDGKLGSITGQNNVDDYDPTVTLTAIVTSAIGGEAKAVNFKVGVKEKKSNLNYIVELGKGSLSINGKDSILTREDITDANETDVVADLKKATSILSVPNTTTIKDFADSLVTSSGSAIAIMDQGTELDKTDKTRLVASEDRYRVVVTAENEKDTREYSVAVLKKSISKDQVTAAEDKQYTDKKYISNKDAIDVVFTEDSNNTIKVNATKGLTASTDASKRRMIGVVVDFADCVVDAKTEIKDLDKMNAEVLEGTKVVFWLNADNENGEEIIQDISYQIAFQDGDTLPLRFTYTPTAETIAKQYVESAKKKIDAAFLTNIFGAAGANDNEYKVPLKKDDAEITKLTLPVDIIGSLIQGETTGEKLPVTINWEFTTNGTEREATIQTDGTVVRPVYTEGDLTIDATITINSTATDSDKNSLVTDKLKVQVIIEKEAASELQAAIEALNSCKTDSDIIEYLAGNYPSILGIRMEDETVAGAKKYGYNTLEETYSRIIRKEFLTNKTAEYDVSNAEVEKSKEAIVTLFNALLETQVIASLTADAQAYVDGLTYDEHIRSLNTEAEDSSKITKEFKLPTTYTDEKTEMNYNITWTASGSAVSATSSAITIENGTAKVTRPEYNTKSADEEVILNPTVTFEYDKERSVTKGKNAAQIKVTVLQKEASDLQKAIVAFNALKTTPAGAEWDAFLENHAATLEINKENIVSGETITKYGYDSLTDTYKAAVGTEVIKAKDPEYSYATKDTNTSKAAIKKLINDEIETQVINRLTEDAQKYVNALTYDKDIKSLAADAEESNQITKNFALPTKGSDEVTGMAYNIAWTASGSAIAIENGTAKVTRPEYNITSADEKVILNPTVTFTYDKERTVTKGENAEKIEVTVLEKPATDLQKAIIAANALKTETSPEQWENFLTAHAITLKLEVEDTKDATGKVTSYGYKSLSDYYKKEVKTAFIDGIIKNGAYAYDLSITSGITTKADESQKAIESLFDVEGQFVSMRTDAQAYVNDLTYEKDIETIAGNTEQKDEITKDFKLPVSGKNADKGVEYEITWKTASPSAISVEGETAKVRRPAYSAESDTKEKVALIPTVSLKGFTDVEENTGITKGATSSAIEVTVLMAEASNEQKAVVALRKAIEGTEGQKEDDKIAAVKKVLETNKAVFGFEKYTEYDKLKETSEYENELETVLYQNAVAKAVFNLGTSKLDYTLENVQTTLQAIRNAFDSQVTYEAGLKKEVTTALEKIKDAESKQQEMIKAGDYNKVTEENVKKADEYIAVEQKKTNIKEKITFAKTELTDKTSDITDAVTEINTYVETKVQAYIDKQYVAGVKAKIENKDIDFTFGQDAEDNTKKDTEASVSSIFKLPTNDSSVIKDLTIKWTSKTTTATGGAITINAEGDTVEGITRPKYTDGNGTVILTATITRGKQTETTERTLTIKKKQGTASQVAVEEINSAKDLTEIAKAITDNYQLYGIDEKDYKAYSSTAFNGNITIDGITYAKREIVQAIVRSGIEYSVELVTDNGNETEEAVGAAKIGEAFKVAYTAVLKYTEADTKKSDYIDTKVTSIEDSVYKNVESPYSNIGAYFKKAVNQETGVKIEYITTQIEAIQTALEALQTSIDAANEAVKQVASLIDGNGTDINKVTNPDTIALKDNMYYKEINNVLDKLHTSCGGTVSETPADVTCYFETESTVLLDAVAVLKSKNNEAILEKVNNLVDKNADSKITDFKDEFKFKNIETIPGTKVSTSTASGSSITASGSAIVIDVLSMENEAIYTTATGGPDTVTEIQNVFGTVKEFYNNQQILRSQFGVIFDTDFGSSNMEGKLTGSLAAEKVKGVNAGATYTDINALINFLKNEKLAASTKNYYTVDAVAKGKLLWNQELEKQINNLFIGKDVSLGIAEETTIQDIRDYKEKVENEFFKDIDTDNAFQNSLKANLDNLTTLYCNRMKTNAYSAQGVMNKLVTGEIVDGKIQWADGIGDLALSQIYDKIGQAEESIESIMSGLDATEATSPDIGKTYQEVEKINTELQSKLVAAKNTYDADAMGQVKALYKSPTLPSLDNIALKDEQLADGVQKATIETLVTDAAKAFDEATRKEVTGYADMALDIYVRTEKAFELLDKVSKLVVIEPEGTNVIGLAEDATFNSINVVVQEFALAETEFNFTEKDKEKAGKFTLDIVKDLWNEKVKASIDTVYDKETGFKTQDKTTLNSVLEKVTDVFTGLDSTPEISPEDVQKEWNEAIYNNLKGLVTSINVDTSAASGSMITVGELTDPNIDVKVISPILNQASESGLFDMTISVDGNDYTREMLIELSQKILIVWKNTPQSTSYAVQQIADILGLDLDKVESENELQNSEKNETVTQPEKEEPTETPEVPEDETPVETPAPEVPKDETPVETPTPEVPKDETPVETPTPEVPKDETPVETPTPEASEDETPVVTPTPGTSDEVGTNK